MNNNVKSIRLVGICALALLSACAGAPSKEPVAAIADDELKDDSIDVLFATEFPVESEQEALMRADQAVKAGDIDKTLFYLVRALQFRPDNVPLLARIGEIQLRRGHLDYAMRAFLMALSHDPDHGRAHEGIGLVYMAKGRDQEAIKYLRLAVANSENLWRAHDVLGVYADKAGDHVTAQYHYDLALAANPDAAHVLNNRGYSKYLAGDIEGAKLDLFEAARERGFARAWINLGKIYAEGGRYKDAIKTYKLVMSEANAFNSTASTAIENGDLLQAERYLIEAIRLSPTYFPSAETNLLHLRELQHREEFVDAQVDSG